MIKTILPSSFGFQDSLSQLVDVHSKGVDSAWMHKRAAAGIFKDADIKPEKDYSFIHLIAMGDADYYGSNRNGDYFYKQATTVELPQPKPGISKFLKVAKGNIETHGTFETHAKVFRNHCFPADAPVLMSDLICKPISEVKVGDFVISGTGTPRKVLNVFSRRITEQLYQFETMGRHTPLVCTGNHPIYTVRRDATICIQRGHRAPNRCYPHTAGIDSFCHERHCDIPTHHNTEEWMPATYVRHGDYFMTPTVYNVPIDPFFKTTEDAYFAGLFFAEGGFSFSDKNTSMYDCSLTFNITERDTFVTWVVNYWKQRGVKFRGPYEHKDNHTLTLQCTDKAFSLELQRMFGKTYSHEWHIPVGLLSCSREIRLSFLGGWLDGDGHVHRDGKALRGRSSSFDGLTGMLHLAVSVGIPGHICRDSNGGQLKCKSSGKTYVVRPNGVLAIHGDFIELLAPYSHKVRIAKLGRLRRGGDHYILPGSIGYAVDKIRRVAYDGIVYNLEVETDSSYIVNSFIVHNCNKNPKQSHGDVVKSAHNSAMNRVELIIKVPDATWSTDLEKLASGNDLAFSMSCRIPHDFCFTADTLVTMSDGTLRPIVDIRVGDTVRTHLGTSSNVTAKFEREYTGKLQQLNVAAVPEPIRCTPNHPFLIIPAEIFFDCQGSTVAGKTRRHTLMPGTTVCKTCNTDINVEPIWRDASELKIDDYLLSPISGLRGTASVDDAYLLGIYTGGSFEYKGYVCRRVTATGNEDVESVPVYNLSVAGTESYIAGSCVVHNCSECGNQAKTRREYCEHLKENMGEITKQGNHIGAINDGMVYFDISQVVVPADRIAFGLLKVASTDHIQGGAELAESMMLFPPETPDDFIIGGKRLSKLAMIRKLSEIEKEIEAHTSDNPIHGCASAFDPEVHGDIPGDLIKQLAVPRSQTEDVLGALADAKISLSLKDFMKIVLGSKFEDVAGHVDEAKDALPGIFGRMTSEPASATGDSDLNLGDGVIPRSVREAISKIVPEQALDDDSVGRRMTITVLRGKAPLKMKPVELEKKSGAISALAGRMATAYAMYKVSFCQRAGDDRVLIERAILQHYFT